MSIEIQIRHRLDTFALDAAFESQGGLTAIFGASGSGKTTLINAIAGLIKPDAARIVIDGTVLTDTQRNIALPVHRRRIGYVFQDSRLFPHLTVEQNLHYGRWFAPHGERYAEPAQVLTLLGIGHLLHRRPSQLSGGERQRVAIGRALLASPRLLLMDEPLASLDHARKEEILPYIERLRDDLRLPIVYVSHSLAEVKRLATGIVVMTEGRVAAFGPAMEIAQRLDLVPPEERDEGGTILEMTVMDHDTAYDMTSLRSAAGEAHVQGRIGAPGAIQRLQIRARDVMIATSEPQHISARNIFRGRIVALDLAETSAVNVRIDCAGSPIIARITRQARDALGLRPGMEVYALVKAISVNSPAAAPSIPGGQSRA
jgi:molybdate transport system ATP-binding protein